MQKLKVLAVVLVILCTVSVAAAGENISGIWKEASGVSQATNIQLMYAQVGNTVHAVGYFEINGVPCVWHGTGTINGNTVEYPVLYSKPYPEWKRNGADGKHVLTLSADGKTVTGKWYNNNGDSGSTIYVKQK